MQNTNWDPKMSIQRSVPKSKTIKQCLADGVVSTTLASRHAASFNDMVMCTSEGEGHHVTVVGSAVNNSSAVSTTIHSDARSPTGVASTNVADGSSTLSTLQRSSSHDAQSSL